jgi:arylsulfatase A-like enzyme
VIAVGLIVSAAVVMHLARSEIAPRCRFIDPALRPAGWAGRASTTRGGAMLTTAYPVASVADESRYVLSAAPHDTVIFSDATPVPADGGLTLSAKLSDILQDADRLVMVPQVQIGNSWTRLPDIVVSSEHVGAESWVQVPLRVPAEGVGKPIGVQIDGFAVSHAHTTSYRTPEVKIPNGAYLAFGIGIEQPAWSQGPVSFSISTCEREQCETLYSESLDPATDAGQHWNDRKTQLQGLGAGKRSFVFESRLTNNDDKDAFSLPLWSNPTIYAPHVRLGRHLNIILLSIDTLSAQHLPVYGYDHDTAPFITETFGKGGTVFEDCVAAAATTPPSHMTMFTSLQPAVHGVTGGAFQSAPEWLVTLAEVMRASGFETAAVTEDGWLATQFGFGRGFNAYAENKSPDTLEPKGDVDATFAKAKEWLAANRDKPFFLFLHTFQVHHPYMPPPQYNRFFTQYGGQIVADDSPRALRDRANYDREIRYTDDQLRLLFQTLVEQGLADNTVFILVSDHGEEFFEHGYWGHGAHLYEEVTHVPLLFWGPGHIPAGRRVSQQVGHIDLMPTMLELAGVPTPSQASGVSLVPLLRGGAVPKRMVDRPLFSEAWSDWAILPDYTPMAFERPGYLIQLGTRKLSRYRRDGKVVYEFYDLAQDPGERKNLFDEKNQDLAALRQQLDEYENAARTTALKVKLAVDSSVHGTPTPVHLNAGQEEKLRALGYLK